MLKRVTIIIQSWDTPPWTPPTRRGLPTPAWWALSTSSVKSSTFPSVSGYWNSTPLTSFPLKSISWGNFSSMRTPAYLKRQKTKNHHAFGLQGKSNHLQFLFHDRAFVCCVPPQCPHPLPYPNTHTPPSHTQPFSGNCASHHSPAATVSPSPPAFLSEPVPETRAETCLPRAKKPPPVTAEPLPLWPWIGLRWMENLSKTRKKGLPWWRSGWESAC